MISILIWGILNVQASTIPLRIDHCFSSSIYYFQRCISENFNQIQQAMGDEIYIPQCNSSSNMTTWYSRCVQSNFYLIGGRMGVYLSQCNYYGPTDSVDLNYANCVNYNFRQIESAFRSL